MQYNSLFSHHLYYQECRCFKVLGNNYSHMQNYAVQQFILPPQHCAYITKNVGALRLLTTTTEALTCLVIRR